MKVLILTTSSGGPLLWALRFKEYCKENHKDVHIDVKHGLGSILQAHFNFHKYDLVHSTVPFLFNISKTPIILNFRGNYKKEINKHHPFNALYPWSKKVTKHYLSPSKFLNSRLHISAKIIPNAVDHTRVKVKKNFNLHKPLKLIMVTRFDIYEKARGVLKISKVLAKLNRKYVCDVYGEGKFKDALQKKCRNLNFKGFSDNLSNSTSTYDIFLYYSFLDNFPNALLDAMSAGMPMITNEVGAVKEMMRPQEGIVVRSQRDFEKELLRVIKSSSLRKSLGTNAHKRIKSEFSWQVVSNKLLEYYEGVINER